MTASRRLVAYVTAIVGAAAAAGAWGSVGALAAPAPVADYSIIARDIIPSGEYQSIPTAATLPQVTQQAQMYNALTPLFGNVTSADLDADFKAEPLNIGDAPAPVTQESVPHAGVTIYRDAYDVPYIYATTDDG